MHPPNEFGQTYYAQIDASSDDEVPLKKTPKTRYGSPTGRTGQALLVGDKDQQLKSLTD